MKISCDATPLMGVEPNISSVRIEVMIEMTSQDVSCDGGFIKSVSCDVKHLAGVEPVMSSIRIDVMIEMTSQDILCGRWMYKKCVL